MMPVQDLTEWLDEQQEHAIGPLLARQGPADAEYGALWYVKRLSANDTQATGGHQAGPYVSREFAFKAMPPLNRPTEANPSVQFEMIIDSHSDVRTATAIWYNNKLRGLTRNETHITGVSGSPLLDAASTGALTVFAFHLQTTVRPLRCHVWVCRDENEANLIQERIGPVRPKQPRTWPDGITEDQWEEINSLAQLATAHGSEETAQIKRGILRITDSARNRAVELRAMEEADRHFRGEGWETVDVSAQKLGYDIRCYRGDEELHVEVKGVSSDGSEVNLTRNEVEHARGRAESVLFVLSNVEVSYAEDGSPIASGGKARVLHPWRVDEDGELMARTYSYRLLHP